VERGPYLPLILGVVGDRCRGVRREGSMIEVMTQRRLRLPDRADGHRRARGMVRR